MKLHGYDLDGLSRYRASFQQLHRKGSRKLGLANLSTVVSGLGDSLHRYRSSLDTLGTRVAGLHTQAVRLERFADAALVTRAD